MSPGDASLSKVDLAALDSEVEQALQQVSQAESDMSNTGGDS
jgi:hypothetical protein